jgi:hypothetical protein
MELKKKQRNSATQKVYQVKASSLGHSVYSFLWRWFLFTNSFHFVRLSTNNNTIRQLFWIHGPLERQVRNLSIDSKLLDFEILECLIFFCRVSRAPGSLKWKFSPNFVKKFTILQQEFFHWLVYYSDSIS